MLLLNKYLKPYQLLVLVGMVLFKSNIAQNLIRNGSFESYTEDAGTSHCVTNFSSMFNWQQIQSPDVYVSSCTFSNHFGVPSNRNGIAYPINGNSYVGIVCFYKTLEVKEYIYQHLSTPLISGKSYYTSFYISRADRIEYAIKKVGVYFSVSQPSVASSNTWIAANPQVENQSGYLTDTISWTKIDGYFTAQGGEEYITIGNFNSNINSDTTYVGTTNPIPFDDGSAYYYIDSVSLYDSLDYVTNIKSHENKLKCNIYPNPNKGVMTLEYDLGNMNEATMNLYDVTGKLLTVYKLPSAKGALQMNEQTLQNGIYFYHILVEGKSIKTDKIVIIK
ncbi:MAG: T9SS type A sorting domain-containing protein [Bacteroidetes bacterium]|nr:T9SS type A sorting domain-containing protein [Bacteroidota bacterium]